MDFVVFILRSILPTTGLESCGHSHLFLPPNGVVTGKNSHRFMIKRTKKQEDQMLRLARIANGKHPDYQNGPEPDWELDPEWKKISPVYFPALDPRAFEFLPEQITLPSGRTLHGKSMKPTGVEDARDWWLSLSKEKGKA